MASQLTYMPACKDSTEHKKYGRHPPFCPDDAATLCQTSETQRDKLRKYCPMSCGLCTASGGWAPAPPAPPFDASQCECSWASRGRHACDHGDGSRCWAACCMRLSGGTLPPAPPAPPASPAGPVVCVCEWAATEKTCERASDGSHCWSKCCEAPKVSVCVEIGCCIDLAGLAGLEPTAALETLPEGCARDKAEVFEQCAPAIVAEADWPAQCASGRDAATPPPPAYACGWGTWLCPDRQPPAAPPAPPVAPTCECGWAEEKGGEATCRSGENDHSLCFERCCFGAPPSLPSPPAPPPTPPARPRASLQSSLQGGRCTMLRGVNLWGGSAGDLYDIASDACDRPDECCERCAALERCTAFTQNAWGPQGQPRGWCYLKSIGAWQLGAARRTDAACTSGVVDRAEQAPPPPPPPPPPLLRGAGAPSRDHEPRAPPPPPRGFAPLGHGHDELSGTLELLLTAQPGLVVAMLGVGALCVCGRSRRLRQRLADCSAAPEGSGARRAALAAGVGAARSRGGNKRQGGRKKAAKWAVASQPNDGASRVAPDMAPESEAWGEGVALTQVAGQRMQASDEAPAWVAPAGGASPREPPGSDPATTGAPRAAPRLHDDEGTDDAFEAFEATDVTVYAL